MTESLKTFPEYLLLYVSQLGGQEEAFHVLKVSRVADGLQSEWIKMRKKSFWEEEGSSIVLKSKAVFNLAGDHIFVIMS